MPTHDETPARKNTEFPDSASNRCFISPLRHVPALRASRLGGLIIILVSVLAASWWSGLPVLLPAIEQNLLLFPVMLVLWLLAALLGEKRIVLAAVAAVAAVGLAGFRGYRWWTAYTQSSIRVNLLFSLILSFLGLGLLVTSDLLLRGIRHLRNSYPGAPDDPARFRPLPRDAGGDAAATPTARVLRLACALLPAFALVVASLLIHALVNPVSQVTAAPPADDPPTRPTRVGTTIAWEKEIPDLLDINSGAAGPVVLTRNGLMALNPTDGSILWSYTRKDAKYVSIPASGNTDPKRSMLVTSPNGRYVAFRIEGPEELRVRNRAGLLDPADINVLTIVVDALTGRVTCEHFSNWSSRLQLSDSALMDGAEAYDLADGKFRWALASKEVGRFDQPDVRPYGSYSGPAGHNSFILGFSLEETGDSEFTTSLTLIPDTDPKQIFQAENIALEHPESNSPSVINGWTVRFTEPVPPRKTVTNGDDGKPGKLVTGWDTQAVTLDSLAGMADSPAVHIGNTTGINSLASRITGTIATYPAYDEPQPIETVFNVHKEHNVGFVFDPATRTTTPASQYPGLAAASVGFTATGDDGSGRFTIRPADGSPEASIPVAPGSSFRPGAAHNHPQGQLVITKNRYTNPVLFLNAPGVTVIVFEPEVSRTTDTEDGSSKCDHRLYGLKEEST